MNDKLLREFISLAVNNGSSMSRYDMDPKRGKSVWEKIKSFFAGEDPVDSIVEEWVNDVEYFRGFDVPPDLVADAKKITLQKFDKTLRRNRGDIEATKRSIKRGLSRMFYDDLKRLEIDGLD